MVGKSLNSQSIRMGKVPPQVSAMIVALAYFEAGEMKVKQRSALGVMVAALLGGVVLPGPVARADPSCDFQPSPLRFTIDPAFFDSRESFDPNDYPRFLFFFYPRQRRYEVTYPNTGPNGGLEWGTPSLTIGGTTHVGARIDFQFDFPDPAVIPDDGDQIALAPLLWFNTLDVAQRFFPALLDSESALWDPRNYPVSWSWELSFSTGSNTCRFAAEFQIADGHGFDFNIDVNHYLERVGEFSKVLPDTF